MGSRFLRTVAFVLALGCLRLAGADVRLPAVIGDNMVLQRDMALPIWGWAEPGEKVTVKVGDQTQAATAGDDGRWTVKLEPLKAGGPLEMSVAGKNTIALKNILVGEVWVCSGQSNMEMSVGGVRNAAAEIAAADFPKIRLYTVQKAVAPMPQADARGSGWLECSPQTVPGFSAVGYFFGRDLLQSLDVPVGLIHSSWGGTPAESWASGPTLETLPDFQARLADFQKSIANWPEAQKKYEAELKAWQKSIDEARAKAQAEAHTDTWMQPDADAAAWKPMRLPQNWEQAGLNIDGTVWFRKDVDVPAAWAGKDLALSLGPIDDDDTTWFNGAKVGETANWSTPRNYAVPGRLVKAGRNVVAVRVYDSGGGGGLYGKPEELSLAAPGQQPLSLAGDWLYRVELAIPQKPPQPMGPGNPWAPSGLYNAMIAPLIPFGIRGAIWYQGESNAGRAYQYRELFPAMIKDWRQHWGEGDFPFLFVQLANFMQPPAQPGASTWAELREAQTMTLALPNTGMAVIIDIGEAKDIHPKNKQDVGKRLALWARARVYGQDIVYSGPLYESMAVEGSKVRLKFQHVGGGLVAAGGEPLKQFAIAGEDQKFVWANAQIDGDTVVVSSDEVAKPVAVRYAWADNPEGCNLANKAGLPASPFRTDQWPGVTAGNK